VQRWQQGWQPEAETGRDKALSASQDEESKE
jgi:hypothetical protein